MGYKVGYQVKIKFQFPGFADQLMQLYIQPHEFIKTDNFTYIMDHLKKSRITKNNGW